MFALFFNNGFYGEQRIEGIHSAPSTLLQHSFNTPSTLLQHEFSTQSQNFDHMKKKDTRLCQILVNHQIATSPESSQT